MPSIDLEKVAAAAEAAADLARAETLSRFRSVTVETKDDGTPVTEADLAAERVIRKRLQEAFPEFSILGEEFGAERQGDGPEWIIDPIDGTIGFSRGIPLFSTLIALAVDGEPVMGLIDLPALNERYVGWKGGGCRRNGKPTRVSEETDLQRAIISHGDPFCFDERGERPAFERMAREIPMLRGYTDAFGYAQVLGGGVGAMVGARGRRPLCHALRARGESRSGGRQSRSRRRTDGIPFPSLAAGCHHERGGSMGWVQLTSDRVDLVGFQGRQLDPGLFPRVQHDFDGKSLDRKAVGLVRGVEDGKGLGSAGGDDDRRRDEDVLATHDGTDHLNLADIALVPRESVGGARMAVVERAASGQGE
ncbi:MAG: hypothetical protein JRD03_08370 [Deltaproteobacteria bacterium]|nr:hypothetical protein [Deltaproteobacteria bacterium]